MNDVIYTVENFPLLQEMRFYKKVRDRHGNEYYNIACAFDIETSVISCDKMKKCNRMRKGKCKKEKCPNWIPPESFMYIWQFCLNGYTCVGRTWEEYTRFIEKITSFLELNENTRLAVYVHNLAYEFQFIKDFFPMEEVFAKEERKPIRARSGGIEYRCSYMLSNMSLKKFLENTPGVVHQKLEDFSYDTIRTSKTELTTRELEYCVNDVIGLVEAIKVRLKYDSIVSIPMTSTGYVRRDCREAAKSNKKNDKIFKLNALTLEQYDACQQARRGGNTHANALYAGILLKNLISFDLCSSYTARMMIEKYPQRFARFNVNRIDEWIKEGYACLFRVQLAEVEKKSPYGIPYLSVSKMYNKKNCTEDNGRILSADYIDMWVTDVDWRIIESQYTYRRKQISHCYCAKYDYLPEEIRKEIMKYFIKKSTLKNVSGKEYEYAKSKNSLNSIFGMMLTDIIHSDIIYQKGEWSTKVPNREHSLQRYYKSRNSFLSYQHGVWVTAWARKELERGLSICEPVYCDTDSTKTFAEYEDAFKKLNNTIWNEIEHAPIAPVIEHEGKTYAMGIWENDANYEEFITWGAKKYAYKKKGKDSYETTVSGLGVKEGSAYINRNGIEQFKPGTVFYPSGRLNAFYNDEDIHIIRVNNVEMTSASNVAMVPGTYTLGISDTYKSIILEAQTL